MPVLLKDLYVQACTTCFGRCHGPLSGTIVLEYRSFRTTCSILCAECCTREYPGSKVPVLSAEKAEPPQDSEMKEGEADAEDTENQGGACDTAQDNAAVAPEEALVGEEEDAEQNPAVSPQPATDADAAVEDESIAGPQGGHSTAAPEADKDGAQPLVGNLTQRAALLPRSMSSGTICT